MSKQTRGLGTRHWESPLEASNMWYKINQKPPLIMALGDAYKPNRLDSSTTAVRDFMEQYFQSHLKQPIKKVTVPPEGLHEIDRVPLKQNNVLQCLVQAPKDLQRFVYENHKARLKVVTEKRLEESNVDEKLINLFKSTEDGWVVEDEKKLAQSLHSRKGLETTTVELLPEKDTRQSETRFITALYKLGKKIGYIGPHEGLSKVPILRSAIESMLVRMRGEESTPFANLRNNDNPSIPVQQLTTNNLNPTKRLLNKNKSLISAVYSEEKTDGLDAVQGTPMGIQQTEFLDEIGLSNTNDATNFRFMERLFWKASLPASIALETDLHKYPKSNLRPIIRIMRHLEKYRKVESIQSRDRREFVMSLKLLLNQTYTLKVPNPSKTKRGHIEVYKPQFSNAVEWHFSPDKTVVAVSNVRKEAEYLSLISQSQLGFVLQPAHMKLDTPTMHLSYIVGTLILNNQSRVVRESVAGHQIETSVKECVFVYGEGQRGLPKLKAGLQELVSEGILNDWWLEDATKNVTGKGIYNQKLILLVPPQGKFYRTKDEYKYEIKQGKDTQELARKSLKILMSSYGKSTDLLEKDTNETTENLLKMVEGFQEIPKLTRLKIYQLTE